MTPSYERVVARTEPERRAEQLGFALRSLAAELVDERRKVAALRRKVAELNSLLESAQATPGGTHAELDGAKRGPAPRNTEAV